MTSVHFSEIREEDVPQLITHVETTRAGINDEQAFPAIYAGLAEKELLPDQHLVDMSMRLIFCKVSTNNADLTCCTQARGHRDLQFAHIVGAIAVFIGMGLEWISLLRLRRARTEAQALEYTSLVSLQSMLVTGGAAVLFAARAYMRARE